MSQGDVMEVSALLSQEVVPGTAIAAKIMSTASCRLRPAPSFCESEQEQWLLICITCGRSKAHDQPGSNA